MMKNINRKFKFNLYNLNGIVSILTFALSAYLIFNVFRYAQISMLLFSLAILFFVLLNMLSGFLDLASKDFKFLKIPSIIFAILLLLTTIAGNYYFLRINASINEVIVETDKKHYEDVTTSLVSYNTNAYTKLEDVVGKKLGYIENDSIQEGNILIKEELTANNLNVTFVGYENYTEMILALFNKEIDVAPLPEDYYAMFISNDGYEEYLDKTEAFYSFTKKVEYEAQDSSTKDITKEPFTVLLIGNADNLADTIILATFNPQTMTATMTSIARDSFVPIACYNNQASDKITHSRVVNRQCTIDTVENLLDVDVDYFVEVNFQAVVDIVDALGGLYLNSPVEFVGQDASSIRGTYTVWVGKGWQTMDGLQALAFARERHNMPNGDMDRQEHQQEVISAIIAKLMDTKDITKLVSVVDAAGKNVKTNFPLSHMTTLAQYMIAKMDNSAIDSSYLLQIKNSRISGYFSWDYNMQLELPLSIYKPYQSALNDAKKLIYDNLEEHYVTNNIKSFTFDVGSPYATPIFVKEYYDEKEIHTPLPDFMPNMVGSNKIWNLASVQSWASARPWINVNYREIWAGDPDYVANFANNQVRTQSVKYGVLTSKITSMTIGIVKQELDCSIEENRSDSQCRYIVPQFVGMKLADVQAWSAANNFPVTITLIPETDLNYDRTKIGVVSSQLEAAYTKLSKLSVSNLTVFTMDYPTVKLPVATILSKPYTKTEMDTWWTTNMYTKTPTYEYDVIISTYPKDTIIGVSILDKKATEDTVVRTDSKTIKFILSPGNNYPPKAENGTVAINGASGPYTGTLVATDQNKDAVLTYTIVTQPTLGTLVLNGNSYTYTPPATYTAPATDTFTFKANDGSADSNVATVTITIN